MRTVFLFVLGILVGLPACCQPQLANIYDTDNQAGSVFIYAENHGFVPYTVSLRAHLVNMRSADSLPARIVVFPSKLPRLLTVFTYTPGQLYSYKYFFPYQIGIYTGRVPDTTYVYSRPFKQDKVACVLRQDADKSLACGKHYDYLFQLPTEVPICAAREGILASIVEENENEKFNFLIVLHDDGTYAYYTNFKHNGAAMKIGQRVAKGDIIANTSANKRHSQLLFRVVYPGLSGPQEVPVLFENNDIPSSKP